jgi:hypothetical protein
MTRSEAGCATPATDTEMRIMEMARDLVVHTRPGSYECRDHPLAYNPGCVGCRLAKIEMEHMVRRLREAL